MVPGIALKGAILGFPDSGDLLEVLEYPEQPGAARACLVARPSMVSRMSGCCATTSPRRARSSKRGA